MIWVESRFFAYFLDLSASWDKIIKSAPKPIKTNDMNM